MLQIRRRTSLLHYRRIFLDIIKLCLIFSQLDICFILLHRSGSKTGVLNIENKSKKAKIHLQIKPTRARLFPWTQHGWWQEVAILHHLHSHLPTPIYNSVSVNYLGRYVHTLALHHALVERWIIQTLMRLLIGQSRIVPSLLCSGSPGVWSLGNRLLKKNNIWMRLNSDCPKLCKKVLILDEMTISCYWITTGWYELIR